MRRLYYEKHDLGRSFGIAVGVTLLAQIVLTMVFLKIGSYELTDPETGLASVELYDWAFWLMQTLYSLCIGASAFVFASVSKTDIVTATALDKKPPIAHIGWGCLATLFLISCMMPINEMLMTLIERLGLPRPSVDMPMQIVPMILVACFLPAITEEMVFRGTVARACQGYKNKLAALAISGALFSLFHLNPAQTVHQFVLGAFLSLLVFRSGSLWTSIAVHLFNNLVAVGLSFLPVDDSVYTNYWWVFLIVGLVGFAACMVGYLKTTRSHWDDTRENPAGSEPTAQELHSSKIMLAISVAACGLLWIVTLVTG